MSARRTAARPVARRARFEVRSGARRRVLVAAPAVTLALLVGACSADLPEPAAPPPPAVAPAALTVPQSERVLTTLGEVLTEADEKRDAKALEARVEGPALVMRTAEYVRSSATEGKRPPTSLPTEALAMIVPQTTAWSRTQLVITEQPEDLQAQRILVLRQDAPRSVYKLWGWARLMPGAQMPPTAPADEGSEQLAADDDSLLVTPATALEQFMDVAANADASTFAKQFADSPLVDEMEKVRAQDRSSMGTVGQAATSYLMDPEPVVSLRTVDGGAVVVGSFNAIARMTITGAGSSLPLSDPFYAALAGTSTATKEFKRTYTGVVVLYVPPAGSDAQLRVLAGELVVTAATAS